MLKPHPLAALDASGHLVILKRYDKALHGHIAEQDHKDDRRKQKHVKRQIFFQLFFQVSVSCVSRFPHCILPFFLILIVVCYKFMSIRPAYFFVLWPF